MANKDLKIEQLCNLVALECKLTPATVRKILDALYNVILKQLELNGRIYFYNFGAFELKERPSGDVRMGNFNSGETVVRYVAPRNKIFFNISESFDRAINEGEFKAPIRRKKYRKSRAQIIKDYNEKHKSEKPTTEELLAKALNVSQARKENDEVKVRKAKK